MQTNPSRRSGTPLLAAAIVIALPVLARSQCGDCNEDGIVNVLDSLAAAQHAVGTVPLFGQGFANCDVDSSGAVNILDGLLVAQAAAQVPVTLNCGGAPGPGSCANPLALPAGQTLSGSTVGAGNDGAPSCSVFSFAEDLVYAFVLPATRNVQIDLTNQSYASCLYVRSSCASAGSELGCDRSAGPQQILLPGLPAGTYYVWVDGDSTAEGTFNLRLTLQ